MTGRERDLLMLLEQSGTWITAAALSVELGCTPRTVKATVARLNERYSGVVHSGSHGYRLGDTAAVDALLKAADAAETSVPQSVQERKTHILCQLLMRHNELNVESFAQELCVSLATLDNEVRAINKELAGSGVTLRIRSGRLCASGNDGDKKSVVSNLLFGETRDFFNQLELVNAFFPDFDIRELRVDIDSRLKKAGFFINGYALSNLVLHVAIALERCLNNFPVSDAPIGSQLPIVSDVRKVASQILDAIEKKHGITFTRSDCRSFELILSATLVDAKSLEESCLASGDVSKLLDVIRARVMSEFAIDLSDEEFGVRFAFHLENLIERGRREISLRNPQLGLIKNAYPYVYEIAVFIAEIVQHEMNIVVSEDEIAFIALHVGCFIEERGLNGTRLRALVVSPRHNAADTSYLEDRLMEHFGQDLSIVAIAEDPDGLKGMSQPDIIIATQELHGRFGAPVVRISPFMGEVDRALIRSRVESVRRASHRRAMERSFRMFFSHELFFINAGFSDERDAIETMGDALIECGSAFPDFKESLYAREEMSSSAYRDIALPHPIDMDAFRTAVAVSLHPVPIRWMGDPVHVVFMLSVARQDREFFREVFELMAHVLNDPMNVRALSCARTPDEFIETLLKYY